MRERVRTGIGRLLLVFSVYRHLLSRLFADDEVGFATVINGDTLKVGRVTHYLAYIDAPDLNQPPSAVLTLSQMSVWPLNMLDKFIITQ